MQRSGTFNFLWKDSTEECIHKGHLKFDELIFLDVTFSFHELGYYFTERRKLQTSRSKAATQYIDNREKLIYFP